MLQAKLVDREKLKLERVEIPKAKEGEVVIQVKVCGVCGSDIHFYEDRHPFIHPRMVLGHELSGILSQIGPGVEDLRKSDRVTVEPNIACGKCYNCLKGRYNICLDLKFMGAYGYNGGFAEYLVAPASIVVKIPEKMGFEEAALIEPAAVGIHAVRRSGQKLDDRVIVMGAGTIGLSIMQAALWAGAKEIIITDLLDYRLKKALELGADEAINPMSGKHLSTVVKEKWGSEAADVIYDCVSTEETLSQAIEIARKGTKIVTIGCPQGKLSVDVIWIQNNELELIGSVTYVRDDFITAMDLIRKKKIKMLPLLTHHFKLEDIDKAFQLMLEKKDEVIKVLIKI